METSSPRAAGLESPEAAQSRKSFSVSHLLDLGEAAAMNGGTEPAGVAKEAARRLRDQPGLSSSGGEAGRHNDFQHPQYFAFILMS
ncbi:paired mesoderm homeobox protein 1-like [Carcharodon carcharias]|uniref:paired mesoderm homeobox protein 1-like n=1 Tax=Carcharodon carcharias TaxID=13397 RepID=UPI001B7E972E|nr:paired mesoderm homeobox protein 1-like [Carcharodon carcharias]